MQFSSLAFEIQSVHKSIKYFESEKKSQKLLHISYYFTTFICFSNSNLIVPKVGREASSCNSSTGDAKTKGSSLAPGQSEL